MTEDVLDSLLNEAIYDSLRNNILNLYHGRERSTRNPNRISPHLQSTISSRYYNTPPTGGYQLTEEHEYNLDYDDINSLIFLDITTRFASPITDTEIKNMRKEKIKKIKYHKVKEEVVDTECPICLEQLHKGEYQKVLDCKHCFHKKCIDRWFKKDNDFCPMCRLKVIK